MAPHGIKLSAINHKSHHHTMASDELRTVLSPLLSREQPAIWITKKSYVCFRGDRTVEDRRKKQFRLQLSEKQQHHGLSIHSSTLEEAIICLDYLVGLKDTHFEEMALSCKNDGYLHLYPFGVNVLEKMLQNSARRIVFIFMIFTPDHCRTLATSGTKTSIGFWDCNFQDKGAAFVEASAARQDETSGPAKLKFGIYIPFNDINWALFLSQHKLDYLQLHELGFYSDVGCRAVAIAEVRCLKLQQCDLGDEGAALVESVREGRSPRDLCIIGNPFGSSDSFVTFMNALRGNTYLERLELWWIDDRQFTQALSAALHEDKGLVHLGVHIRARAETGWTELLKAISLHPSLWSLDLRSSRRNAKKKRDFTKAVADMLSVNDRVEVMSFDDDTFDKGDWDAFVVPRLECNLYRKHFPSIHKVEEASTRAAVLGRALAKFASKPHLVLMLLNQNHDIVSCYLD
jgi:hypothetical protein